MHYVERQRFPYPDTGERDQQSWISAFLKQPRGKHIKSGLFYVEKQNFQAYYGGQAQPGWIFKSLAILGEGEQDNFPRRLLAVFYPVRIPRRYDDPPSDIGVVLGDGEQDNFPRRPALFAPPRIRPRYDEPAIDVGVAIVLGEGEQDNFPRRVALFYPSRPRRRPYDEPPSEVGPAPPPPLIFLPYVVGGGGPPYEYEHPWRRAAHIPSALPARQRRKVIRRPEGLPSGKLRPYRYPMHWREQARVTRSLLAALREYIAFQHQGAAIARSVRAREVREREERLQRLRLADDEMLFLLE